MWKERIQELEQGLRDAKEKSAIQQNFFNLAMDRANIAETRVTELETKVAQRDKLIKEMKECPVCDAAIKDLTAKLKVATDGLQRMAGHRAMMVANPARQILNQIKQA